MKIICISGKAQHGKDTFAGLLKDHLETCGKCVLVAHFSDLLKYICAKFFGWNGEKDQKGRSLLQYVGTDVIRRQIPDYWVNFIIGILRLFKDEWDYVLLPDCRFPNEYEAFVSNGFNTTLIRIQRENFMSPLNAEQQMHESETSLDNFNYDYVVKNDTMEKLNGSAFSLSLILRTKGGAI